MAGSAYIDTSALAKWYVYEDGSQAVNAFIIGLDTAIISTLTVVEMRCLLARRRRNRQLSEEVEQRNYAAFQHHIAQGILDVLDVESRHFVEATHMISMLPHCALRTLDALHLAVAVDAGLGDIATADQGFADAAVTLGLAARMF